MHTLVCIHTLGVHTLTLSYMHVIYICILHVTFTIIIMHRELYELVIE